MESKDVKIYVGLAVWALVLCSMTAFWITESVLVLQGRKNATDSTRLVQVNTILDTMMMDQVHNASFENALPFSKQNKEITNMSDFKVR